MKKINKIAISFIATFALWGGMSSCTDLDEIVYDQIPSDQFGLTQDQVNAIIAPVYKTLKNYWPGDLFCVVEQTGDMAITPTRRGGDWWDGGVHMELGMHTWTSRTGAINNSWNAITQGISRCNQVYAIIEDNQVLTAELKTQTLAEIRGVRAFWYYVMIDMFGNGPLFTDFKDVTVPGTTSRAELYQFVISELNAIKDVVRSDITTSSYGKFTRGAAYTLLAKMYLNAGEWTGTPNWQGVVDACDAVMGMEYIIEPNWKTNFLVHNEVSKECIFPLVFGTADGGNHLHFRTLHYLDPIALGMTLGTWNGISAMSDYVRLFDEEDQRYVGSFLMGPSIDPNTGQVLITAHDRPLIHYIDFETIPGTEKDGTLWGEVNQEDGARCNKWEFERGLANAEQENDFHIFRLADVYLMKAEALIRLGQDNAEATRLINVIRERGFGNSDHNYTAATLDDVYLERRLEMAWENYARQDAIRFGAWGKPILWRTNPTPEYRKLFPVPFEAWQSNNKLVQNPGYPGF
ncbi:MAG: RagB/SusD family nutrient uptake outer membrane protein [Tannerella sp.]|jgi:hypothetical protein|nr:RagB/SusD family nutrient uptake outer membrane protein [Tannerella sp.]